MPTVDGTPGGRGGPSAFAALANAVVAAMPVATSASPVMTRFDGTRNRFP